MWNDEINSFIINFISFQVLNIKNVKVLILVSVVDYNNTFGNVPIKLWKNMFECNLNIQLIFFFFAFFLANKGTNNVWLPQQWSIQDNRWTKGERRGECWERGAGAAGMPLASVWSVGDMGLWRVYKKMSVQNLSFSASMKWLIIL